MTNVPFKIDYNGEWFYHGTIINRKSIIKLFSSVLVIDEDGTYHLRTPVEDCLVEVEDVPFIINRVQVLNKGGEQIIIFKTNLGDKIELGKYHPLWMREKKYSGELIPYVLINKGIEARVSRNVYYDLVEHLERVKKGNKKIEGITSNKLFFPLDKKSSPGDWIKI